MHMPSSANFTDFDAIAVHLTISSAIVPEIYAKYRRC